jgi:glycosyltransferase involved in cell wall biosynthesis
MLTISVVLATYNSARYLRAQLESIAAQRLAPKEIVISDDCSSDDTLKVLESFQKSCNIDVRLFVNRERLGATRNFERALRCARGELIALSDADDLWYPDRLLTPVQAFSKAPTVGLVCCDADLVNADGFPLHQKLSEVLPRGRSLPELNTDPLSVLIRGPMVPGMTMCFRSSLLETILPIPPDWHHDAWIAILTSVTASILYLSGALVAYREHEGQTVGVPGHVKSAPCTAQESSVRLDAAAGRYTMLLDRLSGLPSSGQRRRAAYMVNEKIRHFRQRALAYRLGPKRRIPLILLEAIAGRYSGFSSAGAAYRDLTRSANIPQKAY